MPTKREPPITTAEVAALLKRDTRTIQRWAENGSIPTVTKLPGQTGSYIFDRVAVLAFLETLAPLDPSGGDLV